MLEMRLLQKIGIDPNETAFSFLIFYCFAACPHIKLSFNIYLGTLQHFI